MKLLIKKEVEVKGWSLRAYLGEIIRWWDEDGFEFNGKEYHDFKEFKKDHPGLVMTQPPYYVGDPKEGTETIVLNIDLETGKVKNWPEGVEHGFYDKIVDTGRWEILDEVGNVVVGKTDYVVSCLEIEDAGWGDYLEFIVGEDGFIRGWEFDQDDFDEIAG